MKRILIVDDEEDFCFFVKKGLEATKGFKVEVCSDSKQAVGLVEKMKPDLILLDIVMPDVSGTDIAESLKGNDNTKNIPIVYLTALVTDEEIKANRNTQTGSFFVAKPVNINDLVGIIEKLTK